MTVNKGKAGSSWGDELPISRSYVAFLLGMLPFFALLGWLYKPHPDVPQAELYVRTSVELREQLGKVSSWVYKDSDRETDAQGREVNIFLFWVGGEHGSAMVRIGSVRQGKDGPVEHSVVSITR